MEALSSYEERRSFAAWLFGIARNLCAQHHRKRYAHPEVALSVEGEACALDGITRTIGENPERALARKALLNCIRSAFASLSRDRREALKLRFWGQLSALEIGKLMSRNTGAVKMLIWRGIEDLRRRCVNEF